MKLIVIALLLLTTAGVAWGDDYVIGEGDGLDISVWGVRELNFPVKVRPDGKITVPGLGDVLATGQTPVQLTSRLTTSLKDLVRNPIVTVTVREITNSKCYIFGGGIASGVYDLGRRTTLLQLLCSIGNAGAKVADYRRAYVLRKGKKVKEDFHKLFVTGETADDIIIENGDAIFIPQLPDRNVYILGAVNVTRAIEYREGLSVMEAILEAGGFTKFARQNDTVVFRREGDKEMSIPVKAKDLIKDGDLKQNVKLKPGDYVIVKEGMF